MKKMWKIVINSLLTGGITFLSTLVPLDYTVAWQPALISAGIAGGLSLMIEMKRGMNSPPAAKADKSTVGKKANSALLSFGFI